MTSALSFPSFKNITLGLMGLALALSCFFTVSVPRAHAAQLTSSQIQAIVGLLQSFNADASTVDEVQMTLSEQSGVSLPESTSPNPVTGSAADSAGGSSAGALRENVSNVPTTPAVRDICPQILRSLTQGARGSDVGDLQDYLGVERTGYFGPLTAQAVSIFQAREGIEQVGAVGPLTRAAFARRCGQEDTQDFSTTQTCPVYQVTACSAGQHRVDGTPTYDANNCSVPHWSCVADTTTSTQSCPVYQVTACPAGQHRVDGTPTYDSNRCEVPHWSCVADTSAGTPTFSATPTSGAAPLSVTFVSSSSGTINFGDGTSGQTSPNCLSSAISSDQSSNCTTRSYAAAHTYQTAGTYTAQLLNSSQCITAGCNVAGTVTVTVTRSSDSSVFNLGAAVAMAPFSLMIDSLSNIFVLLGIGQ